MWPQKVDWTTLNFGIEIEFVGGKPQEVELLTGWKMALEENQVDETGERSGAELQSPPLKFSEREQIRIMIDRLKENGARVNWDCGLHVHIGLKPWGVDIIRPLVKSALQYQSTFQALFNTGDDRLIYCPPLTEEMYHRFLQGRSRSDLRHSGRPQSHRCGINLCSWFDIGTVEIRYANGSLTYSEVLQTVELCLRFVAAIGNGEHLPTDPKSFANSLGVSDKGYPPPAPIPQWYRERIWLENLLLPTFKLLVEEDYPKGEILNILPEEKGMSVTCEDMNGDPFTLLIHLTEKGWEILH